MHRLCSARNRSIMMYFQSAGQDNDSIHIRCFAVSAPIAAAHTEPHEDPPRTEDGDDAVQQVVGAIVWPDNYHLLTSHFSRSTCSPKINNTGRLQPSQMESQIIRTTVTQSSHTKKLHAGLFM